MNDIENAVGMMKAVGKTPPYVIQMSFDYFRSMSEEEMDSIEKYIADGELEVRLVGERGKGRKAVADGTNTSVR